MTLQNSDLRFKVDFYSTTKKFIFTDVFDQAGWITALQASTYGMTYTDVQGIIKATNPAGTTFYGGAAYANNSFVTPDISSSGWHTPSINLPSTLTKGNYTFYYKIRLHLNTTNFFTDVTNGIFTIGSVNLPALFGFTPVNMLLQVVSSTGAHAGTWAISNMYTGAGNTYIYCPLAVAKTYTPSNTDAIYIIMEYSSTGKSYNYSFNTPVFDLDPESSCTASTITVTDNSVYDIISSVDNTKFISSTPTRAWTIVYPNSVIANYTDTVNPVVVPPNIWTGAYDIACVTTCVYNLSTWIYNSVNYFDFILHTSDTLTTGYTVRCSTCLCDLYNCIVNLNTRLLAASGVDAREYTRLSSIQRDINFNYVMFLAAERCGNSTTIWCDALVAAINSIDCQCDTDTTISREIVPVTGGIIGSAVPIPIIFDTTANGIPATPLTYEVHIFTTSGSTTINGISTLTNAGDIYQYDGALWHLQYNFNGAAATANYPVLINDIADVSSASGSNVLLKTEVIPAATLSTDGSFAYIESVVKVNAATTTDLTMELGITGVCLTVSVTTTDAAYYRLCARLHRVSASIGYLDTWYEIIGTPNSKIEFAPQTTADVFANTITTNIKRNNGGSDVIAKTLLVTKNIK